MTKPLISVALACYNAEPYLAETIESILSQTLVDFEFLIADDVSTDNTKEIILEYARKDSRIIPILSHEKKYCAGQMNLIIQKAQGKYFARMDADDVSYPDRFETQVNYLDENLSVCAVGSATEWIDEEGNLICRMSYPSSSATVRKCLLAGHQSICNPTGIVRMSTVREIKSYNENYHCSEDFDFWLRVSRIGDIVNLQKILLKYRIHKNSTTSTKASQMNDDIISALQKHYLDYKVGQLEIAKIPRDKAASPLGSQRRIIRSALKNGHWKTAVKHYSQMMNNHLFTKDSLKATLSMWEMLPCLTPWIGKRRRESFQQYKVPASIPAAA